MAQKIEIHITKETQTKLKNIARKNKISLSTLAEIIANEYYVLIYKNCEKYINEKEIQRTTIKPRKCLLNLDNINLRHYYSNCLEVYANQELLNKLTLLPTITNKYIQQRNSKIQSEMTKRKEIYYDYNNQIRQTTRLIRENSDYFERLKKDIKK